jgi:hypothetical protein
MGEETYWGLSVCGGIIPSFGMMIGMTNNDRTNGALALGEQNLR